MAEHPSATLAAVPRTPITGGELYLAAGTGPNAGQAKNASVNAWHPAAWMRLPCEDAPEQLHCTEPDPPTPAPPAPSPTNRISSTPLKPDQVRNAFSQIEYGALAEILRSLGVNTSGKSQADLVDAAWTQFSASMGNLDLGQVNAGASFANFEAGSQAWTYYSNPIGEAL
ncbi:MAG: hypothetical protein Q9173_003141 [Seirophora scorigena]